MQALYRRNHVFFGLRGRFSSGVRQYRFAPALIYGNYVGTIRPLGTPYLFPTDICIPNSRIIEYGRRIISYCVLRIAYSVADRALFVHRTGVRRFKSIVVTTYCLKKTRIQDTEFEITQKSAVNTNSGNYFFRQDLQDLHRFLFFYLNHVFQD